MQKIFKKKNKRFFYEEEGFCFLNQTLKGWWSEFMFMMEFKDVFIRLI